MLSSSLGACFYFSPGLTGLVLFSKNEKIYYESIEPSCYPIFFLVVIAIFFGGVVAEKTRKHVLPLRVIRSLSICKLFSYWALLFSVFGAYKSLQPDFFSFYFLSKQEMIEKFNFYYFLWTTGAFLGGISAYLERLWGVFAVFVLLLFFDFSLGFRFNSVLFFLAIFLMMAKKKGSIRFFFEIRWLTVLGFFSFFVLAYKKVYASFKTISLETLLGQIDLDFFISSFLNSEPGNTQLILSEILKVRFKLPLDHFVFSLFSIIPFSRQLGFSESSFNTIFQSELFPSQIYGMAGNIWAEFWALGGWVGLGFFVFFYTCILIVLNFFLSLEKMNKFFSCLVIYLSVYWSFYIHRCDLAYFLKVQKLAFFLWVILGCLSYLSFRFLKFGNRILSKEERYF
jgi:hypothetical protein